MLGRVADNRHARAFAGERQRRGAANARAAPCDEGGLPADCRSLLMMEPDFSAYGLLTVTTL